MIAIELFAGGGGLALGLEKAGIETIAYVEKDKDAAATLRQNRPNWNVLQQDIREVDFGAWQGVDLITGGPPCQAFSYAGEKRGLEDMRGTLFFDFARAVRDLRPKVFLAENVRGILTHDKGNTLATILLAFRELGYRVTTRLVNAVDYGVPQNRERVLFYGVREDLDLLPVFPQLGGGIRTVREALQDVPPSEGASYGTWKQEIFALIPEGGYWRDLPPDLQKSYMGNSYFQGGGKTGTARRLAWDAPSLTLLCSPSQFRTERCHPEENRPLTIREYARIQTFPDSWQFVGSVTSQYRQIGNAVPVELGKRIGNALVQMIGGEDADLGLHVYDQPSETHREPQSALDESGEGSNSIRMSVY